MNYEEIMARIAAGESEEAIVKEFTDNINKANAELRAQEEAKAKAAEAEAKAAEMELRKNDLADAIARYMNEYVVVCGYENPEIQCTDVREILDGLLELIPLFKNLNVQIMAPKASKKVGIAGKGKPAVDDVFAEFFKSLGI
jgi:folate-dependent phosphoribosylglycinamide formyltransferase PurN